MIRGLSAFPITPMDADGVVDTEALARQLDRVVAAGADSIGLLGSTGSYAFLSRAERRRAVEAAAECVAGRVPLLVGIGALRTDQAVALAEDALAAGAAVGLLAPVSYTPLLDDEVFELFRAVAATGLPLCIYNNPATTHFDISPALIGRLARLPGIVAVKNPAPRDPAPALAALRAQVPDEFSVGVSVDWHAAEALLAGADAWYSVLAGLFPRTAARLVRAAQAGDAAEARRLNGELEPVWTLFRTYSSYRVVHTAAKTHPPLPILPLGPEATAAVTRIFETLDLS